MKLYREVKVSEGEILAISKYTHESQHDDGKRFWLKSINISSAQDFVDDNFQGLDDCIEDSDIREYYRNLIVQAIMTFYHERLEAAKELLYEGLGEYEQIITEPLTGIDADAKRKFIEAILSKLKEE